MSEDIQKDMLEVLKEIKDALAPKPEPPAPEPPKKGYWGEFMDFLQKYGVIGLAIAVIIGGAAGNLVSALVADILMPVITFFIPGGAWRDAVFNVGPIVLSIGHFIGAVIDFLIIALIVFIIMKRI